MDTSTIKQVVIDFIREKAPNGVVIGLSGGIDSALVAALCAEALGQTKVLGVVMPSGSNSVIDVQDAKDHAKSLGVECKTANIVGIVGELRKALSAISAGGVPVANLAPRARMAVLYYYANSMNRLVAGTGNRSELLVGYFTKYGDGGVDILPIGGLYKHEVRELAKEMRLPERIITKPPSAGLWEGQTDEKELGITYDELDRILMALFDNNKTPEEASKDLGIAIEKIRKIVAMHEKNKHKLSMPAIAKVR